MAFIFINFMTGFLKGLRLINDLAIHKEYRQSFLCHLFFQCFKIYNYAV
jgi:hypothetical protein